MSITRIAPTVDHASTTARNADLQSVVNLLQERDARKVDVVAPASSLMAWKGNLHVRGAEPVLTPDGVLDVNGAFTPNQIALEGLADRFDVPVKYLKRIHAERPDLWDGTINNHMLGGFSKDTVQHPADSRSFLLRGLRPADGEGPGILRAVLSDKYQIMDSLDILLSALDGIREAGVNVRIDGADLSDRKMRVRVVCEEVQAYAPALLAGYRSPWSGASGTDNPTVFAGFEIASSDVGCGAATITPRLVFSVCSNGAVIQKDVMRNVHLGGKMDHGVVRYSSETQEKNMALIQSMTRDSVRTFLDVDYVQKAIAEMERKAGVEVTSVDAVRAVTKKAGFTKEQTEGILGHFITAGRADLAGVFGAATSYAQTLADSDEAAEVEANAMLVLA